LASNNKDGAKIIITQLGHSRPGEDAFIRKEYVSQPRHQDFPVSIEVDKGLGMVFVAWKSGCVWLLDLETADKMAEVAMVVPAVFNAVLAGSGGLIVINKEGVVGKVTVFVPGLVKAMADEGRIGVAGSLAVRAQLQGCGFLITQW